MKEYKVFMTKSLQVWKIPAVFCGILLSYFEREAVFETGGIPGYHFVKSLQVIRGKHYLKTTSVYTDAHDQEVIVKRVQYVHKNIFSLQLKNEAKILFFFKKYWKSRIQDRVRFCSFIDFVDMPGDMYLIREYVSGKTLMVVSDAVKVARVVQCLRFLESIEEKMTGEKKQISARSSWMFLATFPFYFLVAILKDGLNIQSYMSLGKLFIQSFPYKILFVPKYVFTHRDLHLENIVVTEGDELVIIDPEIATLTIDGLELAIAAVEYYRQKNTFFVETLLENELTSLRKRENFFALSAYYIFQQLAFSQRKGKYYGEIQAYKNYFNDRIKVILSPSSLSSS